MLQVTVGDGAAGVVKANQPFLDRRVERVSPDVAVSLGVVVHTAHASLGSIGGPQQQRFFRHDLRQVHWSVAQAHS